MAEEITDSSLSDAAAVTLQTGNDLIDATQNAIIDAAEKRI